MNEIRKIIKLMEQEADCIAAKRGPISIVQSTDGSTDTAETDKVENELDQCREDMNEHHDDLDFDPSDCDDNVETAKQYCNTAIAELKELAPILNNCDDVDGWVLGELARMSAIAEKVYHYMANEHQRHSEDDLEDKEVLIDAPEYDWEWPDHAVQETTVSYNPKKYENEGMFRKALRRFKGQLDRESTKNEQLFYLGDKLAAIWDTVKKAGIIYENVELEEAPYSDEFKGSPTSKIGQKVNSRKTGKYNSRVKSTGDYAPSKVNK